VRRDRLGLAAGPSTGGPSLSAVDVGHRSIRRRPGLASVRGRTGPRRSRKADQLMVTAAALFFGLGS
jgi:hypothetical protein